MSKVGLYDPAPDIDPETGHPYPAVKGRQRRTITYGAPVEYTVRAPSGNSWDTMRMNRCPNGQNGASLRQAT